MLTARGDPPDRIVGLEIGADDYLPKPFNPRELLARLRAILRRRQGPGARAETLHFGALAIDRVARVVRLGGEERPITSHQFELLWALATRAGQVLTRDALMQLVRGEDLEAFDRSIDVHVSRIRQAIEGRSAAPPPDPDRARGGVRLLALALRGGRRQRRRRRVVKRLYLRVYLGFVAVLVAFAVLAGGGGLDRTGGLR